MGTTIGERIRQARGIRGLTQDALARAAQLIPLSVSRFERDVAEPSRDTLKRLAAALDVSPAWLLTGEGRGPDTAEVA